MTESECDTGQSIYKEKPCPVCGKLFSFDWRICFKFTGISLCYYCKHITEEHEQEKIE
jgi:RNA polymerase subunit RPABC4/transcription elongation factor Spt4